MTALQRLSGAIRGVFSPVAQLPSVWTPTHRHRKGSAYRVISHGVLEADRSDVVIYDDADGTVWVRDAREFYDGRFTALGDTNTQGPGSRLDAGKGRTERDVVWHG